MKKTYLITITTEWGHVEQYRAAADCKYKLLDDCWGRMSKVWNENDLFSKALDQYGYSNIYEIFIDQHSQFTIVPFPEDKLNIVDIPLLTTLPF